MPKSFFITAIGLAPGKHEAAVAALEFARKKSCQAAYFKPVAKSADDAQIKAAVAGAGLAGDVSDYYGLTMEEVFTLTNQGKEGAIMDAVLMKYSRLAAKFEAIVIEGIDLEPTGGALANLDAALAANLASPVILLTGNCQCGCGCGSSLHDASLAVGAYKSRFAEVMALAVVTENPGQVATDNTPALLEGIEVWAIASAKDIATHLETACGRVCGFVPKAVTPKRFEFDLIEKAKVNKQHIVLPEGNDERILRAADDILAKDFADITILGDPDEMQKQAKALGLNTLLSKANLINNKTSTLLPELTHGFYELRKAKGITEEKAAAQMQDRNFFGTMLVKTKKADGMVSGADGTTADTIRPALSIIKTKPGCSIASSVFLMCLADRVWVFGDCAINPNPTAQQLAEIAIISAQTAKAFGVDPRVAMLSYSTGSSGTGPDVDLVKEATQIARESAEKLFPGLPIDGPLQFDAAVDPKTGASKMPGSPVAGQATVMVFPSLEAGNIGYKAVQRTANAVAIGPVIQGLNAPVNDLSRGTLVADIINTVAITALQAMADK
ncbi:phosphate acetyltransferase [Deltaproteobacteria bacterium OttesenSCG-928-M10]|nr:phosphate acetyltransferase [Deltaproteobacteria bacterium OttesenSCG-928-M10]